MASTAVLTPNLGLILDRPPIEIPRQGLQDGKNFRLRNGSIESLNLGWSKFSANWTLNGKVKLIDTFTLRNGTSVLMLASPTDLYVYNDIADTVSYITPAYVTGTASASGTAVTGVGTTWVGNVKPGDQMFFGSATQDSTSAQWFTVLTVNNNLSITLTASAGTKSLLAYTIRKLFTTGVVDQWDSETYLHDGTSGDDLWFATNGLEPIVTWNGNTTFAVLHPELLFTCKSLRVYNNMMIYGNVTQSGVSLTTTIINSDVGLPLNAGATTTGLAEQFVVHSHSDAILTMLGIGDYLVIYCNEVIVLTQFVGDPIIFTFRVVTTHTGPISSRTVVDFGDFHEFIGNDAGYVFDGSSLKAINSHVWRAILKQADPARREEAYAQMDEENGDVIWAVPATTDSGVGTRGAPPEIGWGEHYLEVPADPKFLGSPFSKRDFKFTASGHYQRSSALTWANATLQWKQFNFAWNDQFFQSAFPINLTGDASGQVWILNQTQTGNGVALPSFVRTGRFSLRSGRERDLLTRIYPFFYSLPYVVQVSLYMGDFIGAAVALKATASYNTTPLEGLHFSTFYRRGRVAECAFGSQNGDPWVLDGWDYDTTPGGDR